MKSKTFYIKPLDASVLALVGGTELSFQSSKKLLEHAKRKISKRTLGVARRLLDKEREEK